MKRTLIFLLALLHIGVNGYSQVFGDASVAVSSRLHGVATIGATYRSYSGFEYGAYGSVENKHNTSAGLTFGYKATNRDEPEEGWVFAIGASYQWYTPGAKTELENGPMPVASARFYGGWGYWETRYSANTFNIVFGYRFFNHRKNQ